MKACPFCAEQIQDAAIKCRYCGEFLDETARLAQAGQHDASATARSAGDQENEAAGSVEVDLGSLIGSALGFYIAGPTGAAAGSRLGAHAGRNLAAAPRSAVRSVEGKQDSVLVSGVPPDEGVTQREASTESGWAPQWTWFSKLRQGRIVVSDDTLIVPIERAQLTSLPPVEVFCGDVYRAWGEYSFCDVHGWQDRDWKKGKRGWHQQNNIFYSPNHFEYLRALFPEYNSPRWPLSSRKGILILESHDVPVALLSAETGALKAANLLVGRPKGVRWEPTSS